VAHSPDLRSLPAVFEIVDRLVPALPQFPRALIVAETRRAIEQARRSALRGEAAGMDIETRVTEALRALERPSLRRVINATGVILHTNLGRAPLGGFTPSPGYCNLEYDLAEGRRGKRDAHLSGLIERLLGAPGIAVNNNAAAVFLALNEVAAGGNAVISRGELIEIGDGFRIPEIMERSGAVLREVGTTNRTTIEDYRSAIDERTRLLLRVHPSNFRMEGFTGRPELRELAALGRERNIPVYEDLGSGCIADLRAFGVREQTVSESLGNGANLVSFSGDKLLGGPQAGILAGDAELVARLRRNPLFRALRLDKVICEALETTLRNTLLERWDLIPALAMIRQPAEGVKRRAEALLSAHSLVDASVIPGESITGGGATPQQPIPSWLIALEREDAAECERRLRQNDPPVIARIEDGRVLLDLRTVFSEEETELGMALEALFQPSGAAGQSPAPHDR
jgi:L-seryl-tRNA(Ser) seleniumtransferase